MKIRLSTMPGTPAFNEAGFALRENQWREFETRDMSPEQLDLLEAHTGAIVQVAPDDSNLEQIAHELGLELRDGRFRYAGTDEDNKDKPALGTRHQTEDSAVTPVARKPVKPGPAVTGTMGSGPVATDGDSRPANPQPVTAVPTNVVDPAHSKKTR